MRTKIILTATVLIGGTAFAIAQTSHTGHGDGMDHSVHQQEQAVTGAVLSEPGQGAFAALSEVVRVLEADPKTNWAQVDLAGLRAHLVDMDRLVMDAVVMEADLPDGISAIATGDAGTIATLRRMVPAHAAQLARDGGWTVAASETSDGIKLSVTSEIPVVVAKIKGLGFFGLMASQDHHREHHFMMARGIDAHGH
ncbi:hypothetical protein [uncultured Sulfitobacter sp.]|uniref:hypothetical protein n=1 Tax=uncultured Sulfitobacter sp. TaxID=191468 RepID=UPI0026168E43|nr:hypothetical protein [uncultured Sulfitobacter sp.]